MKFVWRLIFIGNMVFLASILITRQIGRYLPSTLIAYDPIRAVLLNDDRMLPMFPLARTSRNCGFTWTADNQRFMYTEASYVVVYDMATLRETRYNFEDSDILFNCDAYWLPDENRLSVSGVYADETRTYVLNLLQKRWEPFTIPCVAHVTTGYKLTWSLDGTWISYNCHAGRGANQTVLRHLESDTTQIISGTDPFRDAHWLADNEILLFYTDKIIRYDTATQTSQDIITLFKAEVDDIIVSYQVFIAPDRTKILVDYTLDNRAGFRRKLQMAHDLTIKQSTDPMQFDAMCEEGWLYSNCVRVSSR